MDVVKFNEDVKSFVNSKIAVFDLCEKPRIEAIADVCKDYLGVVFDDDGNIRDYKDITDEEHVHVLGDCMLLAAISNTVVKAACGKLNKE